MTNTAKVVRWEADTIGVRLRLWVEDAEGRHLAVAEMGLEESALIAYARAITSEQNRDAQYVFGFDQ